MLERTAKPRFRCNGALLGAAEAAKPRLRSSFANGHLEALIADASMIAGVAAVDAVRASRLPSLPQEQRCHNAGGMPLLSLCGSREARDFPVMVLLWERRKPRNRRICSGFDNGDLEALIADASMSAEVAAVDAVRASRLPSLPQEQPCRNAGVRTVLQKALPLQ